MLTGTGTQNLLRAKTCSSPRFIPTPLNVSSDGLAAVVPAHWFCAGLALLVLGEPQVTQQHRRWGEEADEEGEEEKQGTTAPGSFPPASAEPLVLEPSPAAGRRASIHLRDGRVLGSLLKEESSVPLKKHSAQPSSWQSPAIPLSPSSL